MAMDRLQVFDGDGKPIPMTGSLDFRLTIRTTRGDVQIELFEREPGLIAIRAKDGCLAVFPDATNSIKVGVTRRI